MPFARAHAADAVAQIDAINAFRPLHRAVMHGEEDAVALAERHHFRAALHARPPLGQHEFAAAEIAPRRREQDRDLQRKGELAVEILMQAIKVAGGVLQKQRRRPPAQGLLGRLFGLEVRHRSAQRHPGR